LLWVRSNHDEGHSTLKTEQNADLYVATLMN